MRYKHTNVGAITGHIEEIYVQKYLYKEQQRIIEGHQITARS